MGYATYLCGGGEPLVDQPCSSGGEHTPWPNGYAASYGYACQLMCGGWAPRRCPACGLWTVWRPTEPQPQPPMLPYLDWDGPCDNCDHLAEDHDDRDGCGACALAFTRYCRTYAPTVGVWPEPEDLEDDEWDDDPDALEEGVAVLRGRPVETRGPRPEFL